MLSMAAFLCSLALIAFLAGIHIYGIVLAFSKAWYVGAAALFIPGFATIVGISKLVFNKNLVA